MSKNLDLFSCEQQLRSTIVNSGLKPSELYYILINLALEMKEVYSQAVLIEQQNNKSVEDNGQE